MNVPVKGPRLWPWLLRGVLILLALSAPIVTYRAFTDPDTPDPQRDEHLREANDPRYAPDRNKLRGPNGDTSYPRPAQTDRMP